MGRKSSSQAQQEEDGPGGVPREGQLPQPGLFKNGKQRPREGKGVPKIL